MITFHSLEDRIVKQKMAHWAQGCTCPKDFPVCVCGNKPKVRLITRKPVCANETEKPESKKCKVENMRKNLRNFFSTLDKSRVLV